MSKPLPAPGAGPITAETIRWMAQVIQPGAYNDVPTANFKAWQRDVRPGLFDKVHEILLRAFDGDEAKTAEVKTAIEEAFANEGRAA